MAKFRLRSLDGRTCKVEVASPTLGELRQAARQALGVSADFELSLNKQTALVASSESLLSSIGVCSGDLLWVIPSPALKGSASLAKSLQLRHTSQTAAEASPGSSQIFDSAASRNPDMGCKDGSRPSSSHAAASILDASHADAAMPDVNHDSPVPSKADPLEEFCTILRSLMRAQAVPADTVAAVHAALLQSGFRPAWCSQEDNGAECLQLPLPAQGSVLAADFQYHLGTVDPAQSCTVKISRIGTFAVVAAQAEGSARSAIQLRLACSEVSKGISLCMRPAASGSSSSGQPAPDKAALAGLHAQLETELVVPLVKRCHEGAGQELPAGLLGLRGGLAAQPAELLTRILSHLDAASLAATACTCTELKLAAASQSLWQHLCQREFGECHALDYKAAFRDMWVRREEERRLQQRRRPLLAHPPPATPWFGPHMPGAFPFPPGITGGDYDRLPQPFLQGGPGMLGGPLRQGYRTHQGTGNGRGFGSLGGFRMH